MRRGHRVHSRQHAEVMQSLIVVFATFRIARLTLQTPKLWLVGVATDRDARHACLRFFSLSVFLFFSCILFFILPFFLPAHNFFFKKKKISTAKTSPSLCTVHCALCTVHCALCTVHCALCTVHCSLFTVFLFFPSHCISLQFHSISLHYILLKKSFN